MPRMTRPLPPHIGGRTISVCELGDAVCDYDPDDEEVTATGVAVHTSYGHRPLPREGVEPTLLRFVRDFARLPFPVALDLDGHFAQGWQTEGTPHWLAFAPGGALLRSVYGSQDNAQTRLEYLLAEWVARDSAARGQA